MSAPKKYQPVDLQHILRNRCDHARLLYLPPYSPNLNPIEQAFAKLKALLRTAANRTVDALWHAIGHALDAFSPAECARYPTHAGYGPSNRNPL